MYKLLGTLIAASFTIGCSSPSSVSYQYGDGVDATSAEVKQAVKSFEQTCTHLANNSEFLDSIKLTKGIEQYFTPDYGWNKGLTIQFHVSETADKDQYWIRARGHNCWAYIGGGFKPGIEIAKPTCAALCTASQDGAKYFPDKNLQIVESVDEAKAVAEEKQLKGQEALAKLTKEAEKGDYQAQRNLAYSYSTGQFNSPYEPITGCAWYAVIAASGHKEFDSGDAGNYKLYCEEKLNPDQFSQALQKAAETMRKMGIQDKFLNS
ncbi:hypothetical protein [Methylophilus sp. 5]|uniref:hypothetical protein n=1 Tax=Methylophilus sp. 5 TaxID=1112274 RepID=UPI0012F98F8B|nr:hypothetical protein [Methylophilus sp. 5]